MHALMVWRDGRLLAFIWFMDGSAMRSPSMLDTEDSEFWTMNQNYLNLAASRLLILFNAFEQ